MILRVLNLTREEWEVQTVDFTIIKLLLSRISDKIPEEEEEEEEEEDVTSNDKDKSIIELEETIRPHKTMSAKRWRWEVLDDWCVKFIFNNNEISQ